MTEMTTEERIDTWKKELATAMDDEQWRLALKFCSWLRYTLSLQGHTDPEVEAIHQQAKEALRKRAINEKVQQKHERESQERHRKLRSEVMHRVDSGDANGALDLIETIYADGANQQAAIHLLQALKARSATKLSPRYRQMDQQAATFGKRFDELVERVGGSSSLNKHEPRGERPL